MSTAASVTALLGVGVLAGIVSTVVSLASIVSYPALLALGLSPVSANVTNTVALMFTGAGAAAGSRPELAGQGGRVLRLGLLTAAGGGAGAAILLLTPARGFVSDRIGGGWDRRGSDFRADSSWRGRAAMPLNVG